MANNSTVRVRKADGSRERFVPEKLFRSLTNSGADEGLAEAITEKIQQELVDEDNTKDIYRKAFAMLKSAGRPIAARYSVKRALMELGPTGYPFEDFAAEIFKQKGWSTATRQIRQGVCAEHELDIVGTKGESSFGAEVKFHNRHGLKSDLKVALYVRARFDDLAKFNVEAGRKPFSERWLITNTKFTTQAIEYGACAGLSLLSWDYPKQGNLRELIEETGVHPISCLTTLTTQHKRLLMQKGVVLCRQLREHPDTLRELGLPEQAITAALGETDRVCPAE